MIRRATVADAAAIARVQVDTWRHAYAGIVPAPYLASLAYDDRAVSWRKWLGGAGGTFTFVAEDAGAVFGFAGGGPAREQHPGYAGELYAIYVHPARQRRGAGEALARAVGAELERQAARGVQVWVFEANAPARRFYERLGAERIGAKTMDIGGATLPELGYGWRATATLSRGSARGAP